MGAEVQRKPLQVLCCRTGGESEGLGLEEHRER